MDNPTLSVIMSKREKILGLIYLPCYLFLFSWLLQYIAGVYYPTLGNRELNLIYYLLCGSCTVLAFRDFLLDNFRALRGKAKQLLKELLGGMVRYYIVTIALGIGVTILEHLTGESFANRNDMSILNLFGDSLWLLAPIALVLAPLVEESLFRGLIFGNLRRRSRLLAYGVTVICFSGIHAIGYLSTMSPLGIVVSLLQYVPATIFLCRIYERTDSLFGAMALHSLLNLISLLITHLLYGG